MISIFVALPSLHNQLYISGKKYLADLNLIQLSTSNSPAWTGAKSNIIASMCNIIKYFFLKKWII